MTIGIDEVGRGAWAGPLLVVAVSLPEEVVGLRDSKKLTKKRREVLAAEIELVADFIGYGWVSAAEIDDNGLATAMRLGCERAIVGCPDDASIVIDGNINYLNPRPHTSCLIDGDVLLPVISAASIVAKVARDAFMADQDLKFPGYDFASHVGYGTKMHLNAIETLGLSSIHRWSFKPLKDRFFVEYDA